MELLLAVSSQRADVPRRNRRNPLVSVDTGES